MAFREGKFSAAVGFVGALIGAAAGWWAAISVTRWSRTRPRTVRFVLQDRDERRRQRDREACLLAVEERKNLEEYLAERSGYYQSLETVGLEKAWAERSRLALDEAELLRKILRERLK
jgi:hypothetical protein